MTSIVRAGIYRRVSTTGQERDGTSLDTQRAKCVAYCVEHGYVVAVDEEDDRSGGDLDRPGIDRIREAAREGRIDTLVIYDLDRLSRSLNHQGILFAEIEETHGVRIESVTQDLNGTSGVIIRAVAGALAQVEREKIRERTMRGRASRLDGGNVPTWTCDLYGYKTVRPTKDERRAGATSVRRVVETEAAVVREVFELVASGWSLQQVATELNNRGVVSSGNTRMTYRDGKTAKWQASSISQLVENPAYRGMTVANRLTRAKVKNPYTGKINKKRQVVRPESEWTIVDDTGRLTPEIVDADLWRRANERLTANRGSRTHNQERPMLLRGRLVCAVCGAPLYADHAGKPGRRSYYRCRNAKLNKNHPIDGRERCPARTAVPQADLDAWVWSEVLNILQSRDRVTAEIRRRLDRPEGTALTAERDRLAAQVAQLKRQSEAVLSAFAESEGRLPWSTFETRLVRIEDERATAERALAEIESRLTENKRVAVQIKTLDDIAHRLGPKLATADIHLQTQVLAELGVVIRTNRAFQELSWSLPLPGGTESDLYWVVDLTDVREPNNWEEACVRADQREEAFWAEDASRTAYISSVSHATLQ